MLCAVCHHVFSLSVRLAGLPAAGSGLQGRGHSIAAALPALQFPSLSPAAPHDVVVLEFLLRFLTRAWGQERVLPNTAPAARCDVGGVARCTSCPCLRPSVTRSLFPVLTGQYKQESWVDFPLGAGALARRYRRVSHRIHVLNP